MAYYEALDIAPILGVKDGSIVLAAKVAGRVTSFNKVRLHVVTWEAGRGERSDYLTPAEFSTWRQSFDRPSHES